MINLPLICHNEYDADMEDTMEERSQPPPKKRNRAGVDNRKRQKQGSGVEQEYLGDDENSESENSDNVQFSVTSSDVSGVYSDFQSDDSDLDISD